MTGHICQTIGVFTIGDVIRKLRRERAWTLEELSVHANVSVMALSKIENGLPNFKAKTIEKIATAYGLTVAQLFALIDRQSTTTAVTSPVTSATTLETSNQEDSMDAAK